MIADRQRQPDLRLEHALRAALSAAMQEKQDGPRLVFVAPELFRQIDLEPVGDAIDFDLAVQEAGFLGGR